MQLHLHNAPWVIGWWHRMKRGWGMGGGSRTGSIRGTQTLREGVGEEWIPSVTCDGWGDQEHWVPTRADGGIKRIHVGDKGQGTSMFGRVLVGGKLGCCEYEGLRTTAGHRFWGVCDCVYTRGDKSVADQHHIHIKLFTLQHQCQGCPWNLHFRWGAQRWGEVVSWGRGCSKLVA